MSNLCPVDQNVKRSKGPCAGMSLPWELRFFGMAWDLGMELSIGMLV